MSFGLVTVPVRAFTSSNSLESDVKFNHLHRECHSRIQYKKVCPLHGELRQDEIVSGYEFAQGQYVTLRLHYTVTRTGEELDYKLRLTCTTTPWSARRWFFVCPLVANDRPCGRRMGKLYLPPGARYYGCRHCHELTYTSCQENHKLDSMFKLLAKDTGMDPKTVKRLLREDWD